MEIFDLLDDKKTWSDFYQYKIQKGQLSTREIADYTKLIDNEEYIEAAKRIKKTYTLKLPRVNEISKSGTEKKRVVFSFEREENYVLKLITYLLNKYDNIFPDNIYSFRQNTGVRKAVNSVIHKINFGKTYSYKVDISDYFNSIEPSMILKIFAERIPNEPKLLMFLKNILNNKYAVKNGEVIEIKKGIMAGMPIAGFLADLFLIELDKWHIKEDIFYIRYSDDIIIFSEDVNVIHKSQKYIEDTLKEKNLKINKKKEFFTGPGEKVEFLGFDFCCSQVNVSDMAVKKIKDKLKRKARALYRWKLKKDVISEKAIKAYIRFLNGKFYNNSSRGEMTWCRWYFPVITSDSLLKEIDEYAIECIRFIRTGRYSKKNYELRYEDIKELGFRSLVNNYWKFRDGKYLIEPKKKKEQDN